MTAVRWLSALLLLLTLGLAPAFAVQPDEVLKDPALEARATKTPSSALYSYQLHRSAAKALATFMSSRLTRSSKRKGMARISRTLWHKPSARAWEAFAPASCSLGERITSAVSRARSSMKARSAGPKIRAGSRLAITGVPHCIASTTGSPNPSYSEG